MFSCGAALASPRFARVISLLSLAFLILPEFGLMIGTSSAVCDLPRTACLWDVVDFSEVVRTAVEGLTSWGASRVRFRVSALRSMTGHMSSGYSTGNEEAFQ